MLLWGDLVGLKFGSQIRIANHDNENEGEWINWYTGEVGLIHNHTWSPCLMRDIENERYCVCNVN